MRRVTFRFLLGALLALSPWACANSTTGHQVALQTTFKVEREIDGEIQTDTGWSVRVWRAALSLEALYYFDGTAAFVARPATLPERLASLLRPARAHAHPGHYLAGTALGQMITPVVIDLVTSESIALPESEGVTGVYRSARVVLAAAGRDSAPLREGDVAMLEGAARRGDDTVYFRLFASIEDVAGSVRGGAIDGCAFDEAAEVESAGGIELSIKPSVWLRLVDFAQLSPGTPEEPNEVAPGETARIAFALGVAQLSAYSFSYYRFPF